MPTDNFLFIIGAPKCGTTSLASWLDGSEDLYLLPGKEPGFFRGNTDRFVRDANWPDAYTYPEPTRPMVNRDAYMRLSNAARSDQWAIDASTDYLSDPVAPGRIRDFAESRNVKLVCILRDPVERAFSEYRHTVRDGLEPLSFSESLDCEEERKARGFQPLFFHVTRSRYFEGINTYRRLFPGDLLILSFNELADQDRLAEKLSGFLDRPLDDLGPIERLNESQVCERSFLKAVRKRLSGGRRPSKGPQLTDADRRRVVRDLETDIRRCTADPDIPTDGWASLSLLEDTAR